MELISEKELSDIYGGAPGPDTSFGYDVAYYTVRILIALCEGASAVKG